MQNCHLRTLWRSLKCVVLETVKKKKISLSDGKYERLDQHNIVTDLNLYCTQMAIESHLASKEFNPFQMTKFRTRPI